LQLRFAVEERALAFSSSRSLVLARLARSSGSQRRAAAPRLQGCDGLAKRSAGRCKLRARLRRLRHVASEEEQRHAERRQAAPPPRARRCCAHKPERSSEARGVRAAAA
jgi:hypothetical protein